MSEWEDNEPMEKPGDKFRTEEAMRGQFENVIDVLRTYCADEERFLEEFRSAIRILEAAGKIEWKPDNPMTTIISRFDESTREVLREAGEFQNDWIWQERKAAIEMARALLEAIPDGSPK